MDEYQIIKNIIPNYSFECDIIDIFHQLNISNTREIYDEKIRNIEATTNYDKANKFSLLYKDKFVCIDCDRKIFYVFNNGIWEIDHGNICLIKYIINFYPSCGSNFNKRKSFINDIALHSYNKKFTEKLSNFKSIRIGNVSFDVFNGNLRDGYPNDYCSINTHMPLNIDYKEKVLRMLKDIFPQENIMKYFLRYAGSLLIPGNKDKIFMIWNGIGNNGKSILARLIELAMGEYSIKLPTSLVTGKRTISSGATPELALLEKKLVAFLQEPSHDEKLNIGIVKELTGNDTIYVRGLYKEGSNINVLAKIIYIVNTTDNIAVLEEAIWNRIVVLPFISNFTDKIILPNDLPVDKMLGGKLRTYAGSFMEIMIEEARRYINEGLLECKEIEESTRAVQDENDIIIKYIKQNRFSSNSYEGLIAFIRDFHPQAQVPSFKLFNKRINTINV